MIYNITESYSILNNPISEVLYNIRETINEFEYGIELYNRGYLLESNDDSNSDGKKKSILKRFIDFCKSIINYIKSVPGRIKKFIQSLKKNKKISQKAEKTINNEVKNVDKDVEDIEKKVEDIEKYIQSIDLRDDTEYVKDVTDKFNKIKKLVVDFDNGTIDSVYKIKKVIDGVYEVAEGDPSLRGLQYRKDDTSESEYLYDAPKGKAVYSKNKYGEFWEKNGNGLLIKDGDGNILHQFGYKNTGEMAYRINKNGSKNWFSDQHDIIKTEYPNNTTMYSDSNGNVIKNIGKDNIGYYRNGSPSPFKIVKRSDK